jgi:hypothetical protein
LFSSTKTMMGCWLEVAFPETADDGRFSTARGPESVEA